MNKINYNQMLNQIIEQNIKANIRPKLLLHSCCAPCSSSVLERLHQYFDVTVNFYNPNITDKNEYHKRLTEEAGFLLSNYNGNIKLVADSYDVQDFFTAVKGLDTTTEGGERCFACYALRLRQTALMAKACSFDYFCSTLSVSPHKNCQVLNEIGQNLAIELGVNYLPNDFKKENGFKRSTELSKLNNLYRQDYCGCIYSMQIRKNQLLD